MKIAWSKILPKMMTFFTKKERYKPEIKWSGNSWVHNIFRLYELVFWRRYGIKREMTVGNKVLEDGTIRTTVQLHSFESVFAYAETLIRQFFQKYRFSNIKIWVPQLSSAYGLPAPGSPFLFAIAIDITVDGGATGGNFHGMSWTHTITGSDTLLLINNTANSAGSYSNVNYNSVNATIAGTQQLGASSGAAISMYYLINPTTGANSVSTTHVNNNATYDAISASYTGCSQVSQMDSYAGASYNSFPRTLNTTVVAANCWIVGFAYQLSTSTLSTNRTDRRSILDSGTGSIRNVFADSNGPVGTGSQGFTFTSGGSPSDGAAIVASIAPVAAATTTSTSSTTSSSTTTTSSSTSSTTSSTTSSSTSSSTTTTSSSTSSTTSSSSSTTTTSSSTSSTTSSSSSTTTTSSSTTHTTSSSTSTTTTSSSTTVTGTTTSTTVTTSSTTSTSTTTTLSHTTTLTGFSGLTRAKRLDSIGNTRTKGYTNAKRAESSAGTREH